ncbi:DoxX family protein [Actinomadura algeriensis]|uniref:Oxidoreductase n=1 Tax=Actinomadura algeriensis TaxID=1679523 RepID=A0ABR9K549_9ACTN|nr:DoxX family protein [Actinomadura algeriensis]MBE1537964.1 putative oxidoreductase [Actinomadura algeriensis]
MRSRSLVYDVAAALARLGVGVVFMAHGWRKIEAGVTATGENFDALGVPLPTAAAVYAAFVELLGGAALIAGLALPVTGALLFVDMVGAFLFVHADRGLFMVDGDRAQNGYELVVALGMAALLFAAGAGGRLTLDAWIVRKRAARPDEPRDEDDDEEDAESFVESLRQAELKFPETAPKPAEPPAEPAAPPAPKKAPSRRSAPKPAPEPAEPPAPPAGTEDDKPVAGRRKAAHRRRTGDTQPVKPPADGGAGAPS